MMDWGLKDQIALVTGGTRGIGAEIVRKLAEAGVKTAFTYTSQSSQEKANQLVQELKDKGYTVSAYRVDVRDGEKTTEVISLVEKEYGGLHILVNNAGIIRDNLVMTMSDEEWNDVLQTNLTGTFHTIRAATKIMMRARKGSIVNLSSIAGSKPGKGHVNYAASKGGVESLTQALAVELSSRNIRVNAVAPGMIETDMSQDVRQLAGDQILSRILLKRYGSPQDIANAVLFFASPLSSYITGQTLLVDGGMKIS